MRRVHFENEKEIVCALKMYSQNTSGSRVGGSFESIFERDFESLSNLFCFRGDSGSHKSNFNLRSSGS